MTDRDVVLALALAGCDPFPPPCDTPPRDHAYLLVWDTSVGSGLDLAPGASEVRRYAATVPDAPRDAEGTFALTSADGRAEISVVDCVSGEVLQVLSGTEADLDLAQPFPASCGGQEGCALEVCLRFENTAEATFRADHVVNVGLSEEVDCGEEARSPAEAEVLPLEELVIEAAG